jgi:hypothetical protein
VLSACGEPTAAHDASLETPLLRVEVELTDGLMSDCLAIFEVGVTVTVGGVDAFRFDAVDFEQEPLRFRWDFDWSSFAASNGTMGLVEFYGTGNGETMATASHEFTASPDTPQLVNVVARCSRSAPDAGPNG